MSPRSPTGKGAYVLCTLVPSLPLFLVVVVIALLLLSSGGTEESGLADGMLEVEFDVEEEEDFLVWRAEENIPSGTIRSRR